MINRRDLLIAAGCVAGAGAAYALQPRRRLSLLGAAKLDAIVPKQVGGWIARDVGDLVAPKTEDSLVSRLYGETVERVYAQASSGAEVMMLLAYGDTQSNELQLHRPEICYPAFGFRISANKEVQLPLAPGQTLPGRSLVADAPGRRESIIYWARLGEYLPVTGNEQRLDRVKTAFGGYVADGLLARFSAYGSDPAHALATVGGFIPALIRSVHAGDRRALIGSRLATAMANAGA